jgi:hypothetical protein
VEFTVVFSEAVTDFTAADVALAGSATGTLLASLSGSGANYTVSVSGMTGGGTIVASIPAGVAHKADGDPNEASKTIDNTVTWIDQVPEVTINQSLGQADPTSGSTVQFTVAFTQPVTGFTGADVDLTVSDAPGPLLAAVAGSGSSYTVSVTGMTGDGTVVASIPAGAAQDGDGNTASNSVDNTVTWVDLAPTVTINQGPSQSDPTSASPVVFTVQFNETVTGFTGADVNRSRG